MRVGLAASDPDGLIASPVDTLRRDPAGRSDVERIAAEAAERLVVTVYVGLPRTMSGQEGAAAAAARDYAGHLARRVAPVPVRLVDERLSTVSAHRALHEAGLRERKHRTVIDQVAAVLVLQTALDAEKASGRAAGSLVCPAPGSEGPSGTDRRQNRR